MKKFSIIALGLVALVVVESRAAADEASHRAAVEKLFATMNMEKTHAASLENILQSQSRANPAMLQLQGTMRDFLNKHMGWASLKEEMAKIYQEGFTEAELGELNKFYESPVGRKSIEQMPSLMGKGMAIAQERMKEHLPELQAALKAAAEKQTGVPQTPAPTK
jgi:uncharacterized protein